MKFSMLLLCLQMLSSIQINAYVRAFYLETNIDFKDELVIPELGIQHIYDKRTFNNVSVSLIDDKLAASFYYGQYKQVNESTMTYVKVGLTLINQDPISAGINASTGLLKRFNPRWSGMISLKVPLLSVEQAQNLMISSGIHYYYGSGIRNRKGSEELKKVKRPFLWFLRRR